MPNIATPPPAAASPHAPVARDAQPAPAYDATVKQKAGAKLARIPVKVQHDGPAPKKPDWIRVKAARAGTRFYEIKDILRRSQLVTVCEEA
ncbi:MAG: lipoyl synthase, partial [Burkholderiales bacterium]|nr:lipoyl synthase [Burkholderiales bacterium]